MSSSRWQIGSHCIEPVGDNRLGSQFVGVQEVGVTFPNGGTGKYIGLDVQHCVTAVPLTPDERFVFVRQTRPLATRLGDTSLRQFLEFPSGFSDCDPITEEALRAAAEKELREEAGATSYASLIRLGPTDYQQYPQLSNEINHVFLADGVVLGGKPHSQEPTEEDIEVFTLSPRDVLAVARGELQPAAPLSGSAQAALFWALPAINA